MTCARKNFTIDQILAQRTQMNNHNTIKSGQPGNYLNHLPSALVVVRIVCAPVLLTLAYWNAPGTNLFVVLVIAFLSDVFDGIIARRLGVATEALRRADSAVDTVFYIAVVIVVFVRYRNIVVSAIIGIILVAALEFFRAVFDLIKFRKMSAYHMWSAKLWGISLFLGFGEVFLRGETGILFSAAIILGVVTELEGLAASLVLSEWRHDVPTIYHAWAIKRKTR
jgi:phosphatidylglycerophosphate synthase